MEAQARVVRRLRRFSALERLRPAVLAAPLYRALFPEWLDVECSGLSLRISAKTYLGREILLRGGYEPETEAIFRSRIKPGFTVLDVGANEGFFAALAAKLVGPDGCVVAVEPQDRLQEALSENVERNRTGQAFVVPMAVAEADGETLPLALFPETNTGASGLVSRYRWAAKWQPAQTVTPATLLETCGRDRFDFVKVDVEGYEPEVARALPMDRVGDLLLDYHNAVLRERGMDPADTHSLILRTHRVIDGDPDRGYVLYEPR